MAEGDPPGNYESKSVADKNRNTLVMFLGFADKLKAMKQLAGSEYDVTRQFVNLTIANLTMCEEDDEDKDDTVEKSALPEGADPSKDDKKATTDQTVEKQAEDDSAALAVVPTSSTSVAAQKIPIKKELLDRLHLDFFFPVKHQGASGRSPDDYDANSLRTSMLCLSEIFECNKNLKLDDRPEYKLQLLTVLVAGARSLDFTTVERAVKALSFLSNLKDNNEDLIENNVLEALYDASKRVKDLRTVSNAFNGMMNLSEDIDKMLEYALQGFEEVDDDSNSAEFGKEDGDSEETASTRSRVVSWLIFIKSLPRDDKFFSRPITIESPHPVKGVFKSTLKRPGASAMTVNLTDVFFSSDPSRKEELAYYHDFDFSPISREQIIKKSMKKETKHIFSDTLGIRLSNENENGSPGWGCKIEVRPVFGRKVLSLPMSEKSASKGLSAREASKHNYDYGTIIGPNEVELPGVEAIVVVFDDQSRIRETQDFLVFYIEDASGKRIPYYTLTGSEFWPSASDPLIIPTSKFWYKFEAGGSKQ